jgi:hypothetical protein
MLETILRFLDDYIIDPIDRLILLFERQLLGGE